MTDPAFNTVEQPRSRAVQAWLAPASTSSSQQLNIFLTSFPSSGGGAAQKSPVPALTLDPTYPRLLQQQQVFLQLQILQNQQQNQGPQQQNQQSQQQNQGPPQQQLSLAPR